MEVIGISLQQLLKLYLANNLNDLSSIYKGTEKMLENII